MGIRLAGLLILFSIQQIAVAQREEVKFYEVITQDSIRMFFDNNDRFLPRECALNTRYIRINSEGNFEGYFQDWSNTDSLRGKGFYQNGIKNGYFEVYHPNGNLFSRGRYSANNPIGEWEFFFPNGKPDRALKIKDNEVLLIHSFDQNGTPQVVNGVGYFEGYVAGTFNSHNQVKAKGKILNGKPEEEWVSYFPQDRVYAKEKYKDGKFIRGSFPEALTGKKNYADKPFLNTFLLNTHINYLEEVYVTKCPDTVSRPIVKYNFDVKNFNRILRIRIKEVMSNAEFSEPGFDLSPGDHYMTLQFDINSKNTPENVLLVSSWGQKFYESIRGIITSEVNFPSFSETMYFHLRFSIIPGGTSYTYSYHFSRKRSYH